VNLSEIPTNSLGWIGPQNPCPNPRCYQIERTNHHNCLRPDWPNVFYCTCIPCRAQTGQPLHYFNSHDTWQMNCPECVNGNHPVPPR